MVLPIPSPTPTPTAAPPEVLRFSAVPTGACPDGSQQQGFELAWASQGAEQALLAGPDGQPTPVAPGGVTQACAPTDPVPTWTLEVTGPGGTDSATATPPPPPG